MFSGGDQHNVLTAIEKTNQLLGTLVKRIALLEKQNVAKRTTSLAKKNADIPLAVRVSSYMSVLHMHADLCMYTKIIFSSERN